MYRCVPCPLRRRPAFALVAVLFGLATIAVLMAAAADRAVRHAAETGTEALIARHMGAAAAAADAALLFGASRLLDDGPVAAPGAEETGGTMSLVDVGGLIDVNTAHPDLVRALLTGLDAPAGAFSRHQAVLSRGSHADVGTFAGAVDAMVPSDRLLRLATVRSGRAGLSEADVPDELRRILIDAGLWDDRRPEGARLRADLQGGPTYMVYRLFLESDDERSLIATLRLTSSVRGRRVLDLY